MKSKPEVTNMQKMNNTFKKLTHKEFIASLSSQQLIYYLDYTAEHFDRVEKLLAVINKAISK